MPGQFDGKPHRYRGLQPLVYGFWSTGPASTGPASVVSGCPASVVSGCPVSMVLENSQNGKNGGTGLKPMVKPGKEMRYGGPKLVTRKRGPNVTMSRCRVIRCHDVTMSRCHDVGSSDVTILTLSDRFAKKVDKYRELQTFFGHLTHG